MLRQVAVVAGDAAVPMFWTVAAISIVAPSAKISTIDIVVADIDKHNVRHDKVKQDSALPINREAPLAFQLPVKLVGVKSRIKRILAEQCFPRFSFGAKVERQLPVGSLESGVIIDFNLRSPQVLEGTE